MKTHVVRKWYTTAELCEYLGVSVAHIYRMMDVSDFPKPVKIGRINKWNKDIIDEYMFSKTPKVVSTRKVNVVGR